MKKWMPLLAILLVLAGCAGHGQTEPAGDQGPGDTPAPVYSAASSPEGTAEPSPAPDSAADPAQTSSAAEDPAPSPTPEALPAATPEVSVPTDEEVIAAYYRAEEAYSWFQLATLPVDGTDQRTVGDQIYSRVDYESIRTLADLRGYLKGLFSDELVDQLLPYNGTQYVEFDGVLYVQDGGRGSDVTKGDETVRILWEDGADRCTVRVTVEVLDPEQDYAVTGSEDHDFRYEKVGDRWIFTSFSLVR